MDEKLEHDDDAFRAGFIAIAGRPNVGKSTLINQILGQKIAAVTPRPQTTRRQQYGILTLENAQLVFVDTPGVHQALHKLGERMNQEALAALEDVDLILILVDGSEPPNEDDELLAAELSAVAGKMSIVLGVNKVDLIPADLVESRRTAYQDLFPYADVIMLSAIQRKNTGALVEKLIELLPEGEPFFPVNQVTDLYEREIAADLIREAALIYLRDEVPHSIAVRIDEYTERGDSGAYIAATLFVERDSQKGIVIGHKGSMLRKVGAAARMEIEAMSSRKVFLNLRVKVRKNWRNDDQVLDRFGFASRK